MKRLCSLVSALVCIGLLFDPMSAYACRRTKNEVHIKNYARQGEDITATLQSLINDYSTIIIDSGTWYISPGIKLRSGVTIKGLGSDKSILKRNDKGNSIDGGALFFTQKTDLYMFTKMNPEDEFSIERVCFSDIHIKDLTIDFNRRPEIYTKEQLATSNLFGIVISQSEGCTIEKCSFVDYMTPDINSGCAVVMIVQSADCSIRDCTSERVTLAKAVYSKDIKTIGNHCKNSVGTCIEYICGTGGIIENNYLDGVYWDVSCIGVNTANCIVRNNVVFSGSHNISCLTLGHKGYDLFSASGTKVIDNKFYSDGVRSILIQNGKNIIICHNNLSCCLLEDSKTPNFGCIVARGDVSGIRDLVIEDNLMSAGGDKIYGAITYVGSGGLVIRRNQVDGSRGIVVLSKGNDIVIENNVINSSEYSICAKSPDRLQVINNNITDGFLIEGSANLAINNNTFTGIVHPTYLYGKWGSVDISDNVFNGCDGIDYLFLVNAAEKDGSIESNCVDVSRNKVEKGPDLFVRFSMAKNPKIFHSITIGMQQCK